MTESSRALPSVPLEPLLERDPLELGPFRLLGRLGAGGMGVAFLAQGQGQWAVVKLVRSELADDQAFRGRLRRELDAIERLDGQSARVLQADLECPTPWFAMEFIPGQTLDHRIRDRGPLASSDLQAFARQLADLIAGIHAAGIVHRDIKPANIMMSPDGPRLIDFGIAEVDEGTQLTRTGSVLGSLGWLAPEQVRGDATSTATDVHAWALAVLFAATGQAPFGGDTSAAALYRVLEATPEVPTTIPEPLRTHLTAALAKDPAARPTLDQLTAVPSVRGPAAPSATVSHTEPVTVPNSDMSPANVSARIASRPWTSEVATAQGVQIPTSEKQAAQIPDRRSPWVLWVSLLLGGLLLLGAIALQRGVLSLGNPPFGGTTETAQAARQQVEIRTADVDNSTVVYWNVGPVSQRYTYSVLLTPEQDSGAEALSCTTPAMNCPFPALQKGVTYKVVIDATGESGPMKYFEGSIKY